MGNKFLLWAFLIIVLVVASNQLFWLGKTTIAWVIIGLTVAVGLQAVYFLSRKVNVKIDSLYLALFTLGILIVFTGTRLFAPDLTADEVEAMFTSESFPVVSADYKGQGEWQLKVFKVGEGWTYLSFNEKTGELTKARR